MYELALAPWEAVLGCQVQVPTLEAPIDVSIPAGINTGQRLRIPGKGLGRKTKGDLLVHVRIVSPKNISAAEKELWEKLQQVSKFTPRA